MAVSTGERNLLDRALDRCACPECRVRLKLQDAGLECLGCGALYPVTQGIADLRPASHRDEASLNDWSKHWSDDNQAGLVQRFFSFYRKAIFARTVRYFLGRYFPASGVFVEAGSGTSETSMRVDKRGGDRVLVAVDVVLPVLHSCDPIMDVRIGGDIFRLPFLDNSIDGVWNVGVMEHFTHEQIDQIMAEIHRVLKPEGVLIALWPGTDSVPQKMLRVVEMVVNLRRAKGDRFRFHPEEISQLRSVGEGREVLRRNGFEPVCIDYGIRSLMAFKTLVGRKV